jgi:hypothetical protein
MLRRFFLRSVQRLPRNTFLCEEARSERTQFLSPLTPRRIIDIQTFVENWHQKGEVRIRAPKCREARMDSCQIDMVFVVVAIVVFLLALRQKPKVEK